ncbi:MAG: hypothetical protein OJF47_000709 [Nitrospira sp.]|nr:MAG: hypothetical protein OJF47_000709 [Nitrospira sp.]
MPQPTARAHGGFFRRTKITSRAWGSPKIPCSRQRARNPGKENRAERVWIRVMGPPGHMPAGVCHTRRTRFERQPIRPNHKLAAGLERKMLSHLPTPICIEPYNVYGKPCVCPTGSCAMAQPL